MFDIFKVFRLFIKKMQRVTIAPFQMAWRKIIRMISPSSIMGKMSEDIRGEIKSVAKKPDSIRQYYLIGNRYVAKKLVYFLSILAFFAVVYILTTTDPLYL